MKFSCLKDNLQYALACTSHLATKNLNLPILNNVLLKAEETSIQLTTTNLEIAIHCTLRGKIEEKGEITLPSKLFSDYTNLLPNEKVDLTVLEDTACITCGKDQTKIKGMPASDFPLIPSIIIEKTFRIPIKNFREAISRVLFSAAPQEARPTLSGIFFKFFKTRENSQGTLILVATDSYRLAEFTLEFPPASPEEEIDQQVIVPAKTMTEVYRILSLLREDIETEEFLTIHFSQNQIIFLCGSVEIISRTIEGNYPDYQQIIPNQFQTTVILDQNDFKKAVKTASLFSKYQLFDISLFFDPKQETLSVKATDTTKGENMTHCIGEFQGKENTIVLNFHYLLDGLNALLEDKMILQMIDEASPCLLTPFEHTNYRYVIMPIRQ